MPTCGDHCSPAGRLVMFWGFLSLSAGDWTSPSLPSISPNPSPQPSCLLMGWRVQLCPHRCPGSHWKPGVACDSQFKSLFLKILLQKEASGVTLCEEPGWVPGLPSSEGVLLAVGSGSQVKQACDLSGFWLPLEALKSSRARKRRCPIMGLQEFHLIF